MQSRLLGTILVVACLAAVLQAQSAGQAESEPSYPRIANLYGAGLSWRRIDEGMEYWKKLGLIAGGGSDWHYDYENPRTISSHEKARTAAQALRSINPRIRILPYYDVIEGPDNPALPASFWLQGKGGQRVSTWPGYYRVNTQDKAVLDFTKNAILARAFADDAWSGVFLDCWEPDSYLVPALRSSAPTRYIVTNIGSLPKTVSEQVNGAVSEDELNLVVDGKKDFDDLMDRYLRWCRDSAKPCLTIVSCHPRTIDADPWKWAKKSQAERESLLAEGRASDPAMMRFGLCFTLMGEGYFAYDGGTQARGSHWWYPEYDTDIGVPLGPARAISSKVWTRKFSGAMVYVNGSDQDQNIGFDQPMKDVSTGQVSQSFVIPKTDGRILIPLN